LQLSEHLTSRGIRGQNVSHFVCRSMDTLADCLMQLKKYTDENEWRQKAADSHIRVNGRLGSETLIAITNLGVCLFNQGRSKESLPLPVGTKQLLMNGISERLHKSLAL